MNKTYNFLNGSNPIIKGLKSQVSRTGGGSLRLKNNAKRRIFGSNQSNNSSDESSELSNSQSLIIPNGSNYYNANNKKNRDSGEFKDTNGTSPISRSIFGNKTPIPLQEKSPIPDISTKKNHFTLSKLKLTGESTHKSFFSIFTPKSSRKKTQRDNSRTDSLDAFPGIRTINNVNDLYKNGHSPSHSPFTGSPSHSPIDKSPSNTPPTTPPTNSPRTSPRTSPRPSSNSKPSLKQIYPQSPSPTHPNQLDPNPSSHSPNNVDISSSTDLLTSLNNLDLTNLEKKLDFDN